MSGLEATGVGVEVAVTAAVVAGCSRRTVVAVDDGEPGTVVGDGAVDNVAGMVVDFSVAGAVAATFFSFGGSPNIAPRTMSAITTASTVCTDRGHDRYRAQPAVNERLSRSTAMAYPEYRDNMLPSRSTLAGGSACGTVTRMLPVPIAFPGK